MRFWRSLPMVAALVAALVSTPACATRPPFGFGFPHKNQTVAPPPVTPPVTPAVYDTTMGTAVDSNGFTSLPLHSGAHRYFVNSATGSDSNSCTAAQSPTTPKATFGGGVGCITDGAHSGDQVLLAEGTSYSDVLPLFVMGGGATDKGGFSPAYPTVIESYNPADPTNESEYGRGDQRNARPVITAAQPVLSDQGPSYLVIKGLEFNPGNHPNQSIAFNADTNPAHSFNYILLENDIFLYTAVGFTEGNASVSPATWTGTNIIVRNSGFYGPWADGTLGPPSAVCLYVAGVAHVVNEDSVFYHCGWNEAMTRDGSGYASAAAFDAAGGPWSQSHAWYIQTNTTGVIVRRALDVDDASGPNMRGDVDHYNDTLLIDNPVNIGMGAGPFYGSDRPSGVSFPDVSGNAVLGSVTESTFENPEWAQASANGTPGSRISYNLFARSADPDRTGATSGFSNTAAFNQPSYVQLDHNTMYLWVDPADPSGQVHYDGCGPYPTQCHTSYDYNLWDQTTPQGTNSYSGSAVFPHAYTDTDLFPAVGYASKAAFATYALYHPEAHIQRTALSVLLAGYGVAPPTDTTAPTLSAATATSPSTGNVTLGVTTSEGDGKLFYELLASATTPHVFQIKLGLDSTGAAGVEPGSLSVASAGTKSVNLSGVPPGTYYAFFTHEDTSSNFATAVSAGPFTVASAGSSTTWDAAHSTDWTLSGSPLLTAKRNAITNFWALAFATAAKTTGSYSVHIDTIDATPNNYIGFHTDNTFSGNAPGRTVSGKGLSYNPTTGNISFNTSPIYTVETATAGDTIKWVATGSSFDLYKDGRLLQSVTFAALNASFGVTAPVCTNPVYPVIANGNGTGTQVTADFSGW